MHVRLQFMIYFTAIHSEQCSKLIVNITIPYIGTYIHTYIHIIYTGLKVHTNGYSHAGIAAKGSGTTRPLPVDKRDEGSGRENRGNKRLYKFVSFVWISIDMLILMPLIISAQVL